MTESNLPPDVTDAMVEEQMAEYFKCINCDKDVTSDSDELVCVKCGDPLCSDCSVENALMCRPCCNALIEGHHKL